MEEKEERKGNKFTWKNTKENKIHLEKEEEGERKGNKIQMEKIS